MPHQIVINLLSKLKQKDHFAKWLLNIFSSPVLSTPCDNID
ncbi:hypothetical protein A6A12_2778 [Vibrio anguillarum]|nr:hypothetical protein A6A12_2778 [Vibrio anguillarum]